MVRSFIQVQALVIVLLAHFDGKTKDLSANLYIEAEVKIG